MLTEANLILPSANIINEVYPKQLVLAQLLFWVRQLSGFSRNQKIAVTKEGWQLKGCILPQAF